jgi:hypothetical protein
LPTDAECWSSHACRCTPCILVSYVNRGGDRACTHKCCLSERPYVRPPSQSFIRRGTIPTCMGAREPIPWQSNCTCCASFCGTFLACFILFSDNHRTLGGSRLQFILVRLAGCAEGLAPRSAAERNLNSMNLTDMNCDWPDRSAAGSALLRQGLRSPVGPTGASGRTPYPHAPQG